MKDLYAALGLNPKSTAAEIAAALKQQPEMAASGTVLMNPKKRAVYDRTHTTLKTIGALRHRLGLDTSETWFLRDHPDFAPGVSSGSTAKSSTGPSADTAAKNSAMKPHPSLKSRKKSKTTVKRLALAAIAAIALMALLYFLK